MSTNSLNTITVDGVTYDAEQYATDHATTKANDELGKDAFLQLLVAQMKYQDPLDPQDNSEYIAELANFSALEQMTNVNTNLESLATTINNIDTSVLVGQLSSMIGKAVNWTTTTTVPGTNGNGATTRTTTMAGMIQGITMSDSTNPMVLARANGQTYRVAISDITNIFEVYDDALSSGTTQAATTTTTQSTTTTAQSTTSTTTTTTAAQSTTTAATDSSTTATASTTTAATDSSTTATASTTTAATNTEAATAQSTVAAATDTTATTVQTTTTAATDTTATTVQSTTTVATQDSITTTATATITA